ncbi:MAG: gephyrin-like molybdotransferase Glp [Gammaproteobacteria bacterium]
MTDEIKTTIKNAPSCMDDYDPDSLDCDIARQRILDQIKIVNGFEQIALRSALGCVLAEDIHSPINVPSHTNSAMDGYAVRGQDLPTGQIKIFKLIGTSLAGKPWQGKLKQNECVRIMTGAVMPSETDTVVMQEDVERNDDKIHIGTDQISAQNVRQAGEDLSIGQLALSKSKALTPSDIGLIASLGIGEVKVFRKLRVAFFSTGDELKTIGQPLEEGQIYDSNRYTLYGMLKSVGVEIIDMGVIKDTREDTRNAFSTASQIADVVISSGGVSVGEADFVKEILEELGQLNFWKIAMKPGRPLTFGKLGDATFFGLPGNPVSVMVTFYQFVLPAMRKMMGASETQSVTLKARCTSKLHKRPGRTEFQRGILETAEDGQLLVHLTGEQGSGILRSMSLANCFIILAKESVGTDIDSIVDVQPFFGLI